MTDNQRLILAVGLMFFILVGWEYFFASPQAEQNLEDSRPRGMISAQEEQQAIAEAAVINNLQATDIIEKRSPRLRVEGDAVYGSIKLEGLRFDDLMLRRFITDSDTQQNLDSADIDILSNGNSEDNVTLFSPANTFNAYFAEIGWIDVLANTQTPNKNSLWQANKDELRAGESVELHWQNTDGVVFHVEISLDKNYMFSIKQEVINHSEKDLLLKPYALISRSHLEDGRKNMIVHEGGVVTQNDALKETSFKKIAKSGKVEFNKTNGWIGFSDKYWLSAFIPQDDSQFSGKFARYVEKSSGSERFQADYSVNAQRIAPNSSASNEVLLFAGAKELKILENYQQKYNIPVFDRAVDFGFLYFITKPIFIMLSYFYSIVGNFGIAILILTVVIKLLLFPLAYKGYVGMNRLKDLQPKIEKLKEQHKDDPQGLQKAMLELYRKEKANPVSGCLPLILQMPVFFALYKVLYVSIEMRGAPFFGWINDLSAPDPTSLFNLFGLLPYDVPSLLQIGFFPILMAGTMYVQQLMNPQPADPTQAMVMKFLPLIFLIMFASFPSGLVIYIAWSNTLSILQQYGIKKLTTPKKTKKQKHA